MSLKIRLVLVFLVDMVLIGLAYQLAYLIRFDWTWTAHASEGFRKSVPIVILIRSLVFIISGLYPWSFRYAGFSEAIRIIRSVAVGSFILVTLIFLCDFRRYVGRTIPVVEFLICAMFSLGFRFCYRITTNFFKKQSTDLPRVLIVGGGATGAMVARELALQNPKHYHPIGIIDDDPQKKHLRIHGIKVLGGRQRLSKIVEDYSVEQIIIALPNAPGKVIQEVILSCKKGGVKFKIVPGLQKLLTGKVELKSFRNVKPEDLLGREAVTINDQEIRNYITNQTVLVTGAGGSIGSELVRQIINFEPSKLVLWDHNENDVYFLELELKKKKPQLNISVIIGDIKDVSLLKNTFSNHRPDVVLHAAAHKHVPLMENNPEAAVRNNIIGSRNLIYAADHYQVKRFVLISTDKAVNPTNIMGATKRITEMLIQAKAKRSRTKYMAVRFGNVIGSNGSAVKIFKKQIEEGGPITVTHPDIRRYFMTISEASQLVLQAGALGFGGEVFILDMGTQVKIVDLAKNLIALSGLELDHDIKIEYSGLRPGEKLYEEMLHDIESDEATKHDKIFVAQPEDFDIIKLRKDIEELKYFARIIDRKSIKNKIMEMVPTYKTPEQVNASMSNVS